MPKDNTWHPRGVRGRQVSPQEAGWILGEEAAKHAEQRQAQLADVEHLVPSSEQTEQPAPKRGRPRKTAAKKKAAPNKTAPASAPKKTKGPKA